MSTNFRMKRVTDPLNDKVKARIVGGYGGGDFRELGYVSSGSEHSADGDSDVVSPSFSGLVFGFPSEVMILQSDTDLFRNVLCSHVYKAVEVFSYMKLDKSVLRRNVMMCLRDLGYNAAVCKAKWESSGGLTAGNYEFIDVVRSDSINRQTRYFVDLDFASEFLIARPTKFYERLLQSLPEIFVGKSEELKQILRTMSEAAKRSLRCRDLHLPPWRKHRFMQNKWLGPYKRTSNHLPSASTTTTNTPALFTPPMMCRSVGFESSSAVNGGHWFPAVTRTR